MVAVTLLYRKGYFRQQLEADGWQLEETASRAVEELLQEEQQQTRVTVEGRTVHLRAWRHDVKGVGGYTVPIYFLDTDLPENSERDHSRDARSLYDKLEHAIVPLFYHDRRRFMDIMAYSIAINGSFFNTQRMVQEYVLNAYFNR